MNIAIIHLSDLHIANKDAIHMEKVNALVNSLHLLKPFEGVILAFSGDIAAKGLSLEYKIASDFLGSICKEITEKHNIRANNIKILIAPGNHDMNRNISNQRKRDEVQKMYKSLMIDHEIDQELLRMKDFYAFSDQHKCFFASEPNLFTRKILCFESDCENKFYLEANLFNTAAFSSDDDNGIHYVPQSVIRDFSEIKKVPFSITIMHHSPDWFWPEQKVLLQELIYNRSNLVFYGHEHYETTQGITLQNGESTVIQSGGAWWENGFANSSFYEGVLNLVSRQYTQYEFVWNAAKQFYQHQNMIQRFLPQKSNRTNQFVPTQDYLKAILSDEKHKVCDDISQYFIFPNLKVETSDVYQDTPDIQTMDDLVIAVEKSSQIMILGHGGSGKTTLARMLFMNLISNYTVLLCGAIEVAGKIQKNIIKETFHDIYSSEDYLLFEQQDRSKKVIIIDDANLIKPAHLSKLLVGLEQIFAHIIIVGEKNSAFDIRERISEELNVERGIKQISIGRCFADKRKALIRKVLEVNKSDHDYCIDQLELQIENALGNQDLSYKLDTDFIVKFSSYYCTHANELRAGNINVFSKVFEASIELGISPHLRRETIGQIKTALGELAYFVHFNKEYPISEDKIDLIIRSYSEKYDEPLSTRRFLEIAEDARLITRCQDSVLYRFKNKDHLAYFVAEAVMRRFNEDDPDAENNLHEIVEFSCFSINPTILKFIAYTTGNMKIVNLLLRQATTYVESWSSYDLDAEQFDYLSATPKFERKSISPNAKKAEIEAEAKKEKGLAEILPDEIEITDIYDYDTNDLDKLNYQLIRALLQMNTISSCLITFSHIMPAQTKKDLISALYAIPNQIFHQWAKEIDDTLEALIDEFLKEDLEDGDDAPKTRFKILSAMQRISVNLLLNLYYSVARNSTTPATIENLSREQYIENTNHRLERLMFLEQSDRWSEFIQEAEDLYDNTNSGMVKNMITSMVHHLLMWSPTLSKEKYNHLISKFRLGNQRKGILIQKSKIK